MNKDNFMLRGLFSNLGEWCHESGLFIKKTGIALFHNVIVLYQFYRKHPQYNNTTTIKIAPNMYFFETS
jgi:hypothetical protein